jgi:NDP-sugar pyrophosphorylase family protein
VALPTTALILAAGLGTRLKPLSSVRAKPAIPIGSEPIIRRIARQLVSQGVSDLVVNLHHLPSTLTAVLGDGSDLGARVRYSWEQPTVLGSAGGPRHALAILGADTFFIVNGDTLTDVDLARLAAAHTASNALVTLALVPNRAPLRYGGATMADDGAVTGFVRAGEQTARSLHFVGVQAASARAFDTLPEGEPRNSVGDVYDGLIRSQPGRIRGFVSNASFWDVGTVADYIRTARAMTSLEGTNTISPSSNIDSTVRATGAIVWDDVVVGPNADVEHSILTDGVQVPAGAVCRRMILVRGTDGATVATPLAVEADA